MDCGGYSTSAINPCVVTAWLRGHHKREPDAG